MTISKEVKIGLMGVVSLVIFFVGFYFLKGADLFSKEHNYFCYFKNVEGLQNSANVQVNGLNIGRVSVMKIVPGKGVKVTLSISNTIDLPAGTVASLESADLLGTKMIGLHLGAGQGTIAPEAELPTERLGGVVDNISSELTPRLRELKTTISSFDTTLNGVNKLMNEENQKEISEALHAIKLTASNLADVSALLKTEGGEITKILHNATSVTQNLAKNNDTISHMLANISSVSRQLNNAPIQKTLEELRTTIAGLKSVVDKVNNNQGSLGLLINNKDLYNNINSAVKSLDSLEKDIKARPGRYLSVSVFGKKQK